MIKDPQYVQLPHVEKVIYTPAYILNFLDVTISSVLQSIPGLRVPDDCPLVGGWTRQSNVFLHCMKPKEDQYQHKQGTLTGDGCSQHYARFDW